ncbi:MAG: hypothetical protein K0S70_657 [Microbacterium sp.]|jgi:hypothetical protein|nr:hypothetical protein [Microbacterium sp.]
MNAGLNGSVSYQDFRAACKRYDRDQLLRLLSELSRGWDGSTHDARGRTRPFLPWDIAGIAATTLQWGTPGGRVATPDDVLALCSKHLNLEHPGEREDDFATKTVLRLLYQQIPYQRSAKLASWARPVALFEQTPFLDDYKPEAMASGWEDDLLGCSVGVWSSVGFALHSAAVHQGSRYPFGWEPGIAAALTALGGEAVFDAVVRRGFSTELSDFQQARREITAKYPGSSVQQFIREPFAYNPIHTSPLIGGIDELFLSPCVPAIEVRSTVYGIAYEGIERWGEAFTRDVGHRFEQYVGRNLRLIDDAQVVPEVEYGPRKSRLKSVDWFVVLPHVVLLIECKAMMPRRDMQEGLGSLAEMHGRLEKPLTQINRSAAAVKAQPEGMQAIPADRPMVGLVVTLGNFDLANAPDVRALFTTADIPTAFIGIDLLEEIVTAPAVELDALFSDAPNQLTGPGVLAGGGWKLTLSGNAVLEEAWSSIPLIKFIDEYRESADATETESV